ncbi:MAG TPA: hypothetical protein GX735_05280 [Firmicutes bacterium]|nr:hypothetical protein [Bacillota bacterium]
MMGYEEQLNRLKRGLQQAQRLRADAETKRNFYLEQREKIILRIRELGVEPEELEQEIKRLQGEMEKLLREAEALIPWELLEKENRKGQG